ncbi:MAG: response regulator [Porticoccaceae bacterium]|nr:response regulator [Porticoccaceae bacterium]
MAIKYKVPLRKSLAYSQTKVAILTAFFLGLIVSSGQIYLDYFSHKSELNQSIQNILATANNAAFHAAYNLDDIGASQITSGLTSNAPIVSATITDTNNNVLGSSTSTTTQRYSAATRWLFGEPQTLNQLLLDRSIHDQEVGKLCLVIDPVQNAETFFNRSVVVLILGIVRNFILALILIALFYYSITRPILRASLPIQRGITDKFIPLPETHLNDEIGVLFNAFNDHLEVIKKQNKQIKESNINLENLVDQRTVELDEKNRLLEAQRAEAIAISEDKSAFLAMMSHEIRTPMNGILGMAELLSKETKNAKMAEYVDAIVDSSKSLLMLTNSALEYSKYETSSATVESTAFNLRGLVDSVIFLMSSSVEIKNLTILCAVDDRIPALVVGDQEKLRQVLINLLSNAIKFTDQGEISLDVQKVATELEDDPALLMLQFAIKDSGIGIPQQAQASIFKPYNQADSSIARRYGGSGLGLAICKAIVEQQNGRIDLLSAPGQGSTFTLQLPFTKTSQQFLESSTGSANDAPPMSDTELRILVVDDVEINRKLLKGQLESTGCHCFYAANGQEAIELVQSQHIDLILMDVHMPVMDGIQACQEIRAIGELNDLLIIGITANLDPVTREKCLAVGMNLVIGKPITQQGLHNALRQALNSSAVPISVTPSDSHVDCLNLALINEHRDALGESKSAELYCQAEESARALISQIKNLDDSDAVQCADSAHALAGLCSNFGFVQLGQLASALETDCANSSRSQHLDIIRQLDHCSATTFAQLAED